MNNLKKLIWGDNIMYALCFAGGYAVGPGFENLSIYDWIANIILAIVLLSINIYSSFNAYKQGKSTVNSGKWNIVVGVALFMVIAVIEYFAQSDNGDLKFPVTAFIVGTAVTAVVMVIYTALTKNLRNSIAA